MSSFYGNKDDVLELHSKHPSWIRYFIYGLLFNSLIILALFLWIELTPARIPIQSGICPIDITAAIKNHGPGYDYRYITKLGRLETNRNDGRGWLALSYFVCP